MGLTGVQRHMTSVHGADFLERQVAVNPVVNRSTFVNSSVHKSVS